MSLSRATPTGDRILEPMIALAGCSQEHRIVVAGSKSVELMLQLHRRGYVRAAATANCGQPAGQYNVVLVDWRRRTLKALEKALDWLAELLHPGGCWSSGLTPKSQRLSKICASRWKSTALSSRREPFMNAAALFLHGAAK